MDLLLHMTQQNVASSVPPNSSISLFIAKFMITGCFDRTEYDESLAVEDKNKEREEELSL